MAAWFLERIYDLMMALLVFGVPLKGSLALLVAGALVYVAATTAYGQVISAFTSTQIAALFGTAILTVLPATMFAGMLVPTSSITGFGAVLGRLFPMTYFLPLSVGAFTKGLGFADLSGDLLILAAFVFVFLVDFFVDFFFWVCRAGARRERAGCELVGGRPGERPEAGDGFGVGDRHFRNSGFETDLDELLKVLVIFNYKHRDAHSGLCCGRYVRIGKPLAGLLSTGSL